MASKVKIYPKVYSNIDKAIEEALNGLGFWVAGQVKRVTVVGQYKGGRVGGRLANSISYATRREQGGLNDPKGLPSGAVQKADTHEAVKVPSAKGTVFIGTSVAYAPYVEYGTHRTGKGGSMKSKSKGMASISFLRLGLYKLKPQLNKRFSTLLAIAHRKYGK